MTARDAVRSYEPAFGWWDEQDLDFLASDRSNHARQVAAAAILGELRVRSVCEVGPGSGYDYADHFRAAVAAGRITYRAYEGSAGLAARLRQCYPEMDVRHGTIADLALAAGATGWDAVYAKAVLEHQADFRTPLRQMADAARVMLVLSWYLPPGEVEARGWDASAGVYVNRYARRDVRGLIEACGLTVATHKVVVKIGAELQEVWVAMRPPGEQRCL